MKEFMKYVQAYKVPPGPPFSLGDIFDSCLEITRRNQCTDLGMWAVVDMQFAQSLASYIGNRKVLEIMAGVGWLAKGLSDCGTNITATDDYSWYKRFTRAREVYPVLKMDAIEAANSIEADILLCSWPPHGCPILGQICRNWTKPIIYIGENEGGCTADNEFFKGFKDFKLYNDFPLFSWWGIRDRCKVGVWSND